MTCLDKVFQNQIKENKMFSDLSGLLEKALYIRISCSEYYFLQIRYCGGDTDCFFIHYDCGSMYKIYTYNNMEEALLKEGFSVEEISNADCVIINN